MRNTGTAVDPKRRKTLLAALCVLTGLFGGAAMADVGGSSGPAMARAGVNGDWAVMAGTSLKTTLEGWARAAGWTLVWDNPTDYRLRASASFRGGFEEVVGRLIDSIYQEYPDITATLYRGNKVLHVREQTLTSN